MKNYGKTDNLNKKPEIDIINFFDDAAVVRDPLLLDNIIIGYEEKVRAESVVQMLDVKSADYVLDLGCGNGRDLIKLLDQNFDNFLGVDFSPEMVLQAQKELVLRNVDGGKVRVGDATNLDFPDNTFDKVIAAQMIEHIPNWGKAVMEMHRVLKHNGYLIINTPNRRSWYGIDNFIYELILRLLNKKGIHPYDEWKTFSELSAVLRSVGFEISQVRGACYIPGFLFLYRVPDVIKKIIIFFVSKTESLMSKSFPKYGYLICIKAKKV